MPDIIDPFDNQPIPGFETVKKPAGKLTESDKAWLKRQQVMARIGAGGRAATRSIIPTGGAVAGGVMGGELGALGGPFAPLTVPAGALIGGVAGGMYGNRVQSDLSKLMPGVAKSIAQDPAQVAADERNFPVTTGLSSFVPALIGGGSLQKALTPRGALSAPYVMPNEPPSTDAMINQTRAAAQRQGIGLPTTLTSPTGYRASRVLPAVIGGQAIERAEAAAPQSVGARIKALADAYSKPTERGAAGEAIQTSAGKWMEGARKTGGDLIKRSYDLAGDTELAPTTALKSVDDKIAMLEGNEVVNRPLLRPLFELRGDMMSGKPMTLQRLHDLRQSLYRTAQPEGLDASFRSWLKGDLYGAMTQDIKNGLTEAGKAGDQKALDALGAFEEGNATWAKRKVVYDRALKKVLGGDMTEDLSDPSRPVLVADKAPEAAWESVRKMSIDDRRAFQKTMASLDPDAQDTVRASIIASLGRDAEGNFAASKFLADMHTMPVQTRVTLFGRDNIEAMDDLQTVLKNISQTQKRSHGYGALGVETALASLFGFSTGGPMGAAGAIPTVGAINYAASHFLAKPDSLKWLATLASASSKGTEAFGAAVEGLRKAASNKATLWPLYESASKAYEGLTAPPEKKDAPAAFDPASMSDEELNGLIEPKAAEPAAAPLEGDPSTDELHSPLAGAVAKAESGGDPTAVSPKGAEGVMQVMPTTQTDPGFGVDPAKDNSSHEKTRTGEDYLNAMLERYGNRELALMAYNWGPGNLDKWLESGATGKVPDETKKYVHTVLKHLGE